MEVVDGRCFLHTERIKLTQSIADISRPNCEDPICDRPRRDLGVNQFAGRFVDEIDGPVLTQWVLIQQ